MIVYPIMCFRGYKHYQAQRKPEKMFSGIRFDDIGWKLFLQSLLYQMLSYNILEYREVTIRFEPVSNSTLDSLYI